MVNTSMRANEILYEYQDADEAKREIMQRIQGIDPNDEEQAKLLDRVYSLVNKTGVVDRFLPLVNSKLAGEYGDEAMKSIAERIVASDRLNLSQKNQFLDNFEKNQCVNVNAFLKDGHYSFNEVFNNDPVNIQMFLEFLDFGAGLQRAGKGEHALAILSQDITQKGTGDIDVKGVPVELKVASTKGSGRLGEGGVSADRVKQILMQFEELKQPLQGYFNTPGNRGTPPKTMNLKIFVDLVNSLDLDAGRRAQIGQAVFQQRFQQFGDSITNVFRQPNASADAVLDAYIAANFDWYKSNPDMGGKWEVMSSMAVGSMSMITATSGKGLNTLRKSGVLASNIPYIWPSQGPDIFYQPNPNTK